MVVFIFLHQFVADDIQRRTDAWLAGEAGVLSDVAQRTPKGVLYRRIVGEVAELASREIPHKRADDAGLNDSVVLPANRRRWFRGFVGRSGDGTAHLAGLRIRQIVPEIPTSVHVAGFDAPFRVVCVRMNNGSQIYLGLSERDQLRVLASLRLRFALLWVLIVLIGSAIVFYSTRRVLRHVQDITDAASRIGEAELSSRVPTTHRNDRSFAVSNHTEPYAGSHRKLRSPTAHDHWLAGPRSAEPTDSGARQAGNVPDRGGAG